MKMKQMVTRLFTFLPCDGDGNYFSIRKVAMAAQPLVEEDDKNCYPNARLQEDNYGHHHKW